LEEKRGGGVVGAISNACNSEAEILPTTAKFFITWESWARVIAEFSELERADISWEIFSLRNKKRAF